MGGILIHCCPDCSVAMNKKTLTIVQNIILEAEEKRLITLLTKRGIHATSFKGISLMKQLTPDFISFRPVNDIDLLIKKRSVAATTKIMNELGYVLTRPPKTFYHEYQFVHPDRIACVVEIHTTAFNFDRSKLLDRLFVPMTETQMTKITNRMLSAPLLYKDPHYIIVLIIHFVLHHCFCGIDRLRTITLTLDQYSKTDWEKLILTLASYKLTLYLSIILDLIAIHENKRYTTYISGVNLPISSRLYKYVFFVIFSPDAVYHTIDTPNPVSKRETLIYVRSLQIIKILCAEQSLAVKSMNIAKAIFLSLRKKRAL